MDKVNPMRRTIKNVVKNYSTAEVKVREATSNDAWGPSSTLMSEIADLSYASKEFAQVMGMLWKRLNDSGRNWRHVYKSLVLLEYHLKNGPAPELESASAPPPGGVSVVAQCRGARRSLLFGLHLHTPLASHSPIDY